MLGPTNISRISRHEEMFGGAIWYVNTTTGNDDNPGTSPQSPYVTIGAGIASAAAGDAISVKQGTYDEAGLALTLDGMELWCEIGVIILDTTGSAQTLLVSGDHCRVRGLVVDQAGQVGIRVTGNGGWLEDTVVSASTVAFSIEGNGIVIVRTSAGSFTTTGYDFSGARCLLILAAAVGGGGAVRGVCLSADTASYNTLRDMSVSGCLTASYEIVAGANYNSILSCAVAGGCGPTVDSGQFNGWADFEGQCDVWPHEHIYPVGDGEGTAVTWGAISSQAQDETNAATTAKDYWGEPTIMTPRATLTQGFVVAGFFVLTATAAKNTQYQFLSAPPQWGSARNGGNVWDEGALALTVDDGTLFGDGDLCVVYSDYEVEVVRVDGAPAGNVVTIEREASQFGAPNTGLRWNHTTNDPGTEVLYVVERPGVPELHSNRGMYLTLAASIQPRQDFYEPMPKDANEFVIMRVVNLTDVADLAMTASLIYC